MNLKTSKVTKTRREHYSVAHLGTQSRDGPVIEVSAQDSGRMEKKKKKKKLTELILDRTF